MTWYFMEEIRLWMLALNSSLLATLRSISMCELALTYHNPAHHNPVQPQRSIRSGIGDGLTVASPSTIAVSESTCQMEEALAS